MSKLERKVKLCQNFASFFSAEGIRWMLKATQTEGLA
jgi:hypothetical protein